MATEHPVCWSELRRLPWYADAYGRRSCMLVRTSEIELRLTCLRTGDRSSLHGHGSAAATLIVIAGLARLERWVADASGGWRYDRHDVHPSAPRVVPGGAYQRMEALTPTLVMTLLSPTNLAWTPPVSDDMREVLEAVCGDTST